MHLKKQSYASHHSRQSSQVVSSYTDTRAGKAESGSVVLKSNSQTRLQKKKLPIAFMMQNEQKNSGKLSDSSYLNFAADAAKRIRSRPMTGKADNRLAQWPVMSNLNTVSQQLQPARAHN